jgi:hypothetical protein
LLSSVRFGGADGIQGELVSRHGFG